MWVSSMYLTVAPGLAARPGRLQYQVAIGVAVNLDPAGVQPELLWNAYGLAVAVYEYAADGCGYGYLLVHTLSCVFENFKGVLHSHPDAGLSRAGLSNFSFQRGTSQPEELVELAHRLGYSTLAITDACSVAGVATRERSNHRPPCGPGRSQNWRHQN
jgi:hypothetical protein